MSVCLGGSGVYCDGDVRCAICQIVDALRVAEEHERPACIHVPGEPSRYVEGAFRCANEGCGVTFEPDWAERWHPRWAMYRRALVPVDADDPARKEGT